MRSARTPALSGPARRTSTAYSSPPIPATRSESRNARRSNTAGSRRARSPPPRPPGSLTPFQTSPAVDSATPQASQRLVRRRGGDGEAIGRSPIQELPHAPGGRGVVAHHQHRELGVVPGLRLAPAGGPAPIERLASLGLIAPFLLECDEIQTALADTTFQVGAARRQQPPLSRMMVPACDH